MYVRPQNQAKCIGVANIICGMISTAVVVVLNFTLCDGECLGGGSYFTAGGWTFAIIAVWGILDIIIGIIGLAVAGGFMLRQPCTGTGGTNGSGNGPNCESLIGTGGGFYNTISCNSDCSH